MSYAEILGSNLIVVIVLFIIEKKWLMENKVEKQIQYDIIANIKPENQHLLKQDLEERTGLQISDITIGDIDFLKDTATIKITYLTKR